MVVWTGGQWQPRRKERKRALMESVLYDRPARESPGHSQTGVSPVLQTTTQTGGGSRSDQDHTDLGLGLPDPEFKSAAGVWGRGPSWREEDPC